jgi:hypothetical protein
MDERGLNGGPVSEVSTDETAMPANRSAPTVVPSSSPFVPSSPARERIFLLGPPGSEMGPGRHGASLRAARLSDRQQTSTVWNP